MRPCKKDFFPEKNNGQCTQEAASGGASQLMPASLQEISDSRRWRRRRYRDVGRAADNMIIPQRKKQEKEDVVGGSRHMPGHPDEELEPSVELLAPAGIKRTELGMFVERDAGCIQPMPVIQARCVVDRVPAIEAVVH